MAKGAIHPNGTNFKRLPRLDIVERMRKAISQGLYTFTPRWLEWAERAPPLELQNIRMKDRLVRNPYPSLIKQILKKYPDARFQDLYVDGNDWSKGNDVYRDDHPVMQFAARQLQLMNEGLPRKTAFSMAEDEYYSRRLEFEKQQKILMAMALDEDVEPMFTTGQGYWLSQIASEEARHLLRIRDVLRSMRRQEEARQRRSSMRGGATDGNVEDPKKRSAKEKDL